VHYFSLLQVLHEYLQGLFDNLRKKIKRLKIYNAKGFSTEFSKNPYFGLHYLEVGSYSLLLVGSQESQVNRSVQVKHVKLHFKHY
jgi:hypothetical protein